MAPPTPAQASERLLVRIDATTESLRRELRNAENSVEGFGRRSRTTVQQFDRSVEQSFRRAAQTTAAFQGPLNALSGRLSSLATIFGTVGTSAAGATLALGGLTLLLNQAIRESIPFESSMFRSEAIIRSTGTAAGQTAEQIRELSEQISLNTLASTLSVEKAAQRLLTFRAVSKESFERTLVLSQDLAALGFGTIETAAVQLGKALEDPESNLLSLRRAGISFTDSQRDLVLELLESNKALEAQKFILDQIEKQVGGAGSAEAQGVAGSIDTLSQRFSELLLDIEAVTGAGEAFSSTLDRMSYVLENFSTTINPDLEEQISTLLSQRENLEARMSALIEMRNQGFGGRFTNRLKEREGEVDRAVSIIGSEIEAINDQIAALNEQIQVREKSRAVAELEGEQRQREIAEERELSRLREEQNKLAEAAAARAAQNAKRVRDTIERIRAQNAGIERQIELYEDETVSLQASDTARKAETQIRQLGLDLYGEEAELIRELLGLQAQLKDRVQEITDARKEQAQAEREAIREQERAAREAARIAERQAQELRRQFEENLREVDDFAKETFDGIVSSTDSSFKDLFESIKSGFIKLLNELAYEALIRPIVMNFAQRFMGGGPGQQGGGFGLPRIPGLGNSSGIGRTIDNFGTRLGFAGPGGTSAVTTIPISSGLGSVGEVAAFGSPLSGTGSLFSSTLSGTLGAAGLGFAAGGLVNSAFGGNQTIGSIGSALGAGVGFALGGPIGGIAGGLLGSLGGLFGGGKKKKKVPRPRSSASGTIGSGGSLSVSGDVALDGGDPSRSIGPLQDVARALGAIEAASVGLIGTQRVKIAVDETSGETTLDVAGKTMVLANEADAALIAVQHLTDEMHNLSTATEFLIKDASDLDEAVAYAQLLDQFRKLGVVTNEVENQVNQLNAAFNKAEAAAKDLLATQEELADIERERQAALNRMREEFNQELDDELLSITNSGSAAIVELQRQQTERSRSAIALGIELVKVEELYGKRRVEATRQQSDRQLRLMSEGREIDRALSAYEQLRRDILEQVNGISSSFTSLISAFERFQIDLQEFLDSLALDPRLSVLDPSEQYAESRNIFNRTLDQARGGDANAIGRLTEVSRAFLEQSLSFNAATLQYGSDYDTVTSALTQFGLNGLEEISVAEQQVNLLTEIRDLLEDTIVDTDALSKALSAAGLDPSLADGLAQAGQDLNQAQIDENNAALLAGYEQAIRARNAGDLGAFDTTKRMSDELRKMGLIGDPGDIRDLEIQYSNSLDRARGGDRDAANDWRRAATDLYKRNSLGSGYRQDWEDLLERFGDLDSLGFSTGGMIHRTRGMLGGRDSDMVNARVMPGESLSILRPGQSVLDLQPVVRAQDMTGRAIVGAIKSLQNTVNQLGSEVATMRREYSLEIERKGVSG